MGIKQSEFDEFMNIGDRLENEFIKIGKKLVKNKAFQSTINQTHGIFFSKELKEKGKVMKVKWDIEFEDMDLVNTESGIKLTDAGKIAKL